jgi:hypothetical protein
MIEAQELRSVSTAAAVEPRMPPHSVEAEQSVLGGLLLDNLAWDGAQHLTDADFFRVEHRLIFAAIGSLVSANKPADVITVFEQLAEKGTAHDCGGLQYLNALAQSVPSAANVRRYAEIVRERSMLRRLIAASDEISTAAFNPQGRPVSEMVADAEARLQALSAAAAPAAQRARPQLLDFAVLAPQKAPPRCWIREGWLMSGPTLLAGSGGSGKSTFAQHEATAGALGRAYFAPECAPYSSLVINCEDTHDDLWLRQEAICAHEQADMADLAGRLFIQSRYGCDNALMVPMNGRLVTTRLFSELRQQLNDSSIDVLWLDNAAHLFGGDHDNRTEVTQFINAVSGLVVGRPFAVVMVAHVSRMQGSEFTGSVAWENACRMRWYLGNKLPDARADSGDEGEKNARVLAKRKANHTAQDHVKFTMRDGLLVPDQAPGRIGAMTAKLNEEHAEAAVIEVFKALKRMGIDTTDAANSPNNLTKQAEAKGLRGNFSKLELSSALNRLMKRGRFTRGVVGSYGNRNDKAGLILHEGSDK